jgi:hypothetical protein
VHSNYFTRSIFQFRLSRTTVWMAQLWDVRKECHIAKYER